MSDWSNEETDDPVYTDRRNFFKMSLPDAQPLKAQSQADIGEPSATLESA